jgi:hypothetical protein
MVPFGHENLQVAADIGLELVDRFGRKDMRYEFALPCMLGSIAGGKDTRFDGD